MSRRAAVIPGPNRRRDLPSHIAQTSGSSVGHRFSHLRGQRVGQAVQGLEDLDVPPVEHVVVVEVYLLTHVERQLRDRDRRPREGKLRVARLTAGACIRHVETADGVRRAVADGALEPVGGFYAKFARIL